MYFGKFYLRHTTSINKKECYTDLFFHLLLFTHLEGVQGCRGKFDFTQYKY